jgi:pimeloyl-ACP methyl ester carboxylesterase
MVDDRLTLPDGRTLAYRVLGDPSGAPIIHFHGTGPTCSRELAPLDGELAAAGLRVVAFNRPGYGASDPCYGRTIAGGAADAAALADHLGLDRYVTTGWSGGGPHAGALATVDASRVAAVGLIAAVGDDDAERDDEDRRIRDATRAAADAEDFAARYVDSELDLESLAPADKALLGEPEVLTNMMACIDEATEQGTLGAAGDHWAVFQGWDFEWGAIAAPVLAWQGGADTLVPPEHLDVIVAAHPATETRHWPDEGHLSILMRYPEIAAATVAAAG